MRDQPGYICWTGETGTDDPYQEAQLALAECRQSCQELISNKYSQSELPDIVKLYGGIQVNTVFSTLTGPDGSYIAPPALLCRKEPAQSTKNHLLGAYLASLWLPCTKK